MDDQDLKSVNLAGYNSDWYKPGAGLFKRVIWYITNALLFNSSLLSCSALKCVLLRLFGASIGKNVVIKPLVKIKYPWNLVIGDNVWIGEGVWIDNLAVVDIGNNICISQDAYLLTGNHDYKDENFGLIVSGIKINDGAWLCARTVTCPDVTVASNTIVTTGSVLSQSTEANGIYRGNPAKYIKARKFN